MVRLFSNCDRRFDLDLLPTERLPRAVSKPVRGSLQRSAFCMYDAVANGGVSDGVPWIVEFEAIRQ